MKYIMLKVLHIHRKYKKYMKSEIQQKEEDQARNIEYINATRTHDSNMMVECKGFQAKHENFKNFSCA